MGVFNPKKNRIARRLILGTVLALCFVLPSAAQTGGAGQKLTFFFDKKAAQESLFTAGPSSKIEWTTGFGKSDKAALKGSHIPDKSYTGMDNAIRLTLATPLPAGGKYNITVWVYVPAAGNEGKETLTGPGVVLNGEYAKSIYKLPSNFGTMPVGEWKEVNIETPLMEAPLRIVDFRFVVNDKPKHPDVWYIDDITITQVGELQTAGLPQWDLSLPSIVETYNKYFLIGNIMNASETADPATTAMFKRHYNVVTAENDMKPLYMSPAKGVYNFASADVLVSWAKANNLKIHGHTLLWHIQSAPWLTSDAKGNPLTRKEAAANLYEYISTVVGHYKGSITWWEVVNEAFVDGGASPSPDWRTVLRTDSPWYKAYENGADKKNGESGADYIYDAFVLARMADTKAVLYYNDFNETEAWKREAMALMAEDLNRKWIKDVRNVQRGRKLVEGLGMQAHYWIDDLNVADVEATIARFIKAGVKISLTELDIPAGSYSAQHTPPLTKEEELAQARLYAELFVVLKKYAANIERVTFWAKADPQSWRGNGSPVLFDKMFAAKPSYRAVIDPEGYLKSVQK